VTTVVANDRRRAKAKYEDYSTLTDYEGALAFYGRRDRGRPLQLDPHHRSEYVDHRLRPLPLEIFLKADPDRRLDPTRWRSSSASGAMGPSSSARRRRSPNELGTDGSTRPTSTASTSPTR